LGGLANLAIGVKLKSKRPDALQRTLLYNKFPSAIELLKSLALYPVYIAISLAATYLLSVAFSSFDATQAQTTGFMPGSLSSLGIGLGLVIIALVIVAPIAEEFLFRGYLYSRLRKVLSFKWTVSLVSGVFGVMHGQPNIIIDAFLLSVALCYVREKTGTVWAGVALHILKKAIGVSLIFIL